MIILLLKIKKLIKNQINDLILSLNEIDSNIVVCLKFKLYSFNKWSANLGYILYVLQKL